MSDQKPATLSKEQFLQQYMLRRANNDSMTVPDDFACAAKAWELIQGALKNDT